MCRTLGDWSLKLFIDFSHRVLASSISSCWLNVWLAWVLWESYVTNIHLRACLLLHKNSFPTKWLRVSQGSRSYCLVTCSEHILFQAVLYFNITFTCFMLYYNIFQIAFMDVQIAMFTYLGSWRGCWTSWMGWTTWATWNASVCKHVRYIYICIMLCKGMFEQLWIVDHTR